MAHSGPQPPPGPPGARPRPRRLSTSSCLSTASTVVMKQEPHEREDVADGLGENLVEDTERVEQPDGGGLPILITGFQGNANDMWSDIEVAESMESIKQEYDTKEDTVNLGEPCVQIKNEPEEAHMTPYGGSTPHQSIEELIDFGEAAPVQVKSETGEGPPTRSRSNSIEKLVDVGEAAPVHVKSEPGEEPPTRSRSNSIEELVDVGEAAPVHVKSEPGEEPPTRSRSNSIEELVDVGEAAPVHVKSEPGEGPPTRSRSNSIEELVDVGVAAPVQVKSEPGKGPSSRSRSNSIKELVDVSVAAPMQVKSEPGEGPHTRSRSNSIEEWSEYEKRVAEDQVHDVKNEPSGSGDYEDDDEEEMSSEDVGVPEEETEDVDEKQSVRPARPSTTLLPATKAFVHPAKLEEMKQQAASILAKHQMEKEAVKARPGTSMEPVASKHAASSAQILADQSRAGPKKKHRRSTSPNQTAADQGQAVLKKHRRSTSPNQTPANQDQAVPKKHRRSTSPNQTAADQGQAVLKKHRRSKSPNQTPADQDQAVPKKHRRSTSPNQTTTDQGQAVLKKHRRSTSPNQTAADQGQAVPKKRRRSTSPNQTAADQGQAVPKKHRCSTSPKDHPSGISPLSPSGVSRNQHSPPVLQERCHSGPMTPSPHNSPLDVDVSPSSTNSGGGGRRRVAHRPPPQFLEEGAATRDVEMAVRDPRLEGMPKRDPRLEGMPKRDPRLEGMSIRDPRLLRRENLMPYRPQLLSLSPPREQRQSERPQERHRTPPREPGVKRGLLKTPPHSMRLQHPSYGGGAGVSQNFKEERTPKKGLLKTPPDHMRLLPPLKHDSDGPSDPDDDPPPKKTRTLDMKSTIKFSPEENERETDNSSEDEHAHNTAGHKKRMLPPATSVTKYEARSPLDQQDEEPRKTYDSAKMSASSSRDRLLSTICSWNPKWILIPEKSKNFPDLLNNEEKYMSKKDLVQFSSSHAYCKHFQDGLFLDLWSNLCKIVLQARKKGRVLITAEVEGEPQELPLLGNIKRRTIICHCGTANNDENKIFKKNDVVIVHSGKYLYFAYVVAEPKTKCISDKVELPNYLRKDRHGKTFTHKCTFPLMVVVPIDNSVDPGKLIYIEKVKNISDDLETMKSLETFSTLSSLSTLVMQPIYYPSMKTVVAKYEALLDRELRPSLLSLIQDIKGNEAPSINVIEGGPGTGKSHLAAVLAKELSSPENYVILTSKSIHELNTLAKLLCGSKLKVEDSKENNAVDAVWCGSKRSRAEWDSLEKISFDTLVKKSDSKTDNTIYRLNEKKEILKKAIHKEEIAICKLIACGKSAEAASLKTSCAKKKMDLSLKESEIEEASKPVLKKSPNPSEILQKCNIILTTFSPPLYCLEAFKNMQRQCRRVVLIVDNASEVVEPIIIRLIRAFNVSDLVLFGDTKQHVPFVPSERARNSGLDVSLMERYSRALRDTEFPPKSRLLTRQFRLHPHVMSPINNHFYNNTMSEIDQNIRTHAFQPYIWFHCSYFSQGEERFRQEADFAEKLLSVVCKIPPYSSDDQKIRSYHVQVTSLCPNVSKILSSSSKSHLPFTPSNLLSSLEFDVLILCVGSATRVAAHKIITPWTRAKRSLFVCGSFDHQSVRGPMTHLLRRAQEKGYLKEITSAQITEEKLEEKIKKY